MPEYIIKIVTEADLTDAELAALTQEKLAKATERASTATRNQVKSQADLKTQLDDTEGSADSVYYLVNGLQDLGEGRVITGIQDVAAGLKNVNASLVANPVGLAVAAFTALAAAVAAWRSKMNAEQDNLEQDQEAFEEFQRSMDDLSEQIGQSLESIQTSMKNAGDASKNFAGESEFDTTLTSLNSMEEAASRLRTHMEAMADVELSATLAQIDEDLQSGNIDEFEAERRRNRARISAAQAREDAKINELNTRRQTEQQEVTAAEGNFNLAKQAAEEALAEQNRVGDILTRSGVNLRNPDENEEVAAGLQERIEFLEGRLKTAGPGRARDELQEALQRAQAESSLLEEGLKLQQNNGLDRVRAQLEEASAELDAQTRALAREREEARIQEEQYKRQMQIITRQREVRDQTATTEEFGTNIKEGDELLSEAAKEQREKLTAAQKELEAALKEEAARLKELQQQGAQRLADELAAREAAEAAAAQQAFESFDNRGFRGDDRREAELRAAAEREAAQAAAAANRSDAVAGGNQEAIRSTLQSGLEFAQAGKGDEQLLALTRRVVSIVATQARKSTTLQQEIEDLNARLDNLDL